MIYYTLFLIAFIILVTWYCFRTYKTVLGMHVIPPSPYSGPVPVIKRYDLKVRTIQDSFLYTTDLNRTMQYRSRPGEHIHVPEQVESYKKRKAEIMGRKLLDAGLIEVQEREYPFTPVPWEKQVLMRLRVVEGNEGMVTMDQLPDFYNPDLD